MEIKELEKNDINQLLFKSNIVGKGTYGLLVEFDDSTLLKIYYKDIINTYLSEDIEELDKEIDSIVEIEKDMLNRGMIDETKLKETIRHIKQLEKTKSADLIKGIATYKNCVIGMFLNNYKEYDELTKIFDSLNKNEKEKVLQESGKLLGDLFKHGIYPRDIKENNILVRKKDLDIKLIDLDDIETRYEDEEYIKKYPHIKKGAISNFENMKKRLDKINEKER